MGSLIRLFLGTPIAIIVTVVIFLVMYALISEEQELNEEDIKTVKIEIGRTIQDTDLAANAAQFEAPKVDTPPPPPPAIVDASFKPDLDGVAAARPDFDTKVDIGTGFNPDRDAQPLVRIPPQYPDRCQGRGSGGEERVVVEFDVTPEGQTVNPRVIQSSNSCLDRSAIRAVERWKYRPKIVEGRAEPRFGVRTVFVYQLTE